jgi:hypothetical protein
MPKKIQNCNPKEPTDKFEPESKDESHRAIGGKFR